MWAGSDIIPGDPRKQNKNGKMFEEFLKRNPNLTVVNSLPQCKGLITRSRIKENKTEESILDFFIVCSLVLPFITQMVIDDKKQHILTNFQNVKRVGKVTESDHFTQYMDLDLEYLKEKPVRQEIFNFKDENSQKIFQALTSETARFTSCFNGDATLEEKIENWRGVLKSVCKQSFKKIRIKQFKTEKVSSTIKTLINKRNNLIKDKEGHSNTEAMDKDIDEITNCIADVEAGEKREKILKHFKFFSENPDKIEMQKMWKMLKRVCPKLKPTLPCAKRNLKGKIVSSQKDIKNLLAAEYKNRLRTRPLRDDLKMVGIRKADLFELKMKLSKMQESEPWSENDLEVALRDLKNNKSRDFEGYANEIFKSGIIGSDLKKSLLIMFNCLKKENLIPKFMKYANVTTVPKSGSLLEPANERGIFRVEIIRSILMRLIYNSKYYEIDENMSDCQMGARKRKGCRNNIWILNGIIYENMKNRNKKPACLQFYDYKQMFDSVNLEGAINDLYDYGVEDDQLQLIYKANKEVYMSVKTSGGLTDRQIITNCVLQGDTLGPILASVQVDKIGKAAEEADIGYYYKDKLPITMLGLIDDVVGVSEAGYKAQQLNVILNVKTSEIGLQYGTKKCKSMIIGNEENAINSELLVDSWKQEYSENNMTGEYELTENYIGEVPIGRTEEYKYLGFTISAKGDNMVNISAIKKKSIGIIRTLLQKLDDMNLKHYYFECGMIYFNVILRGSILYASETYYNLTEKNLRNIERIEEIFLRKILKTTKGCPISQLYLETGQWPARFQIKKLRMLFLKAILDENEQSMVAKFFKLQLEQPTKGDWVSTCINDLKEMNVELDLNEIRTMTKENFKKIIKMKISEMSLEYQ